MLPSNQRARRLLLLTLAFEGGLGGAALVAGYLVGHSPLVGVFRQVGEEPRPVGELAWLAVRQAWWPLVWGAVAAVPLAAGLLGSEWASGAGWTRLRDLVERRLVPLFRGMSVWHFALISLAAGWGEELLFRGLLQAGLAAWLDPVWGPWLALVLASCLFGACHWLTRTYALLAAGVGLYLGGLMMLTDHIGAPIMTHALYDFLALIYLVKWRGGRERAAGLPEPPASDQPDAGDR